MIKRENLDAAIVELLTRVTGKDGDLGRIPENATIPYWILYPLPILGGLGSYDDDTDMLRAAYQITCVGDTPVRTAWMSRRCAEALVGKARGSGFANALTGNGFQVVGRELENFGGLVEGGKELWQSADTYALLVTP